MLRSMFLTFAVAAVPLASYTSAAQSEKPQTVATEVLVFGDVAKSGVYQLPTGTAVSASALLENQEISAFTNGPINIRVIRNGQKVALAARLEQNQKSDFRLLTGDVVFVHSVKKLTTPDADSRAKVAVIHPDKVPLFVTVNSGTTIDQLLSHKALQWQNNAFRLIRTHPRAVRETVTKKTALMAGDVLFVERAAAADVKPITREPVVSPPLPVLTAPPTSTTEDKAADPPAAATAHYAPEAGTAQPTVVQTGQETPQQLKPEPVMANYGAVDGTISDQTPGNGTQPPPTIPTLPPAAPAANRSTVPPIAVPPADTSTAPSLNRDPWETDPPLNATTANLQNPAATQTTSELDARINSSIPAFNASSTLSPAPPVGDTANYGSTPQAPQSQAAPNQTAPAAPGTIPLPSELATETSASKSGATMWYVAGLIGALFVVLGAWIYGSRALAEGPQLRSAAAPQKRPIKKRVQTVSQAPLDGTQASPHMDRPPTPVLKPIVPQAAPATIPVATQPNVQPIPQSAVPLSQLPASPPAPPIGQPNATPRTPPTATPTPVPQPAGRTPVARAPVTSIPISQPVPATMNPQSVAAVPNPATAVPAAARTVQATKAVPSQPEPIPVPDTQTTRVLDALVNNAVPVTEAPVQLPTHLEFFGDSQGPRQLRIDPGQPTLRGPHLGLKAGLESKQTTQTSRGDAAE